MPSLEEIAAEAKLCGATNAIVSSEVVRIYFREGGVAWFNTEGYLSGNMFYCPKGSGQLRQCIKVAAEFQEICERLDRYIKGEESPVVNAQGSFV